MFLKYQKKAVIFFGLTAFFLIVLDRFLKFLAIEGYIFFPLKIIGDFFQLNFVSNYNIAFSLHLSECCSSQHLPAHQPNFLEPIPHTQVLILSWGIARLWDSKQRWVFLAPLQLFYSSSHFRRRGSEFNHLSNKKVHLGTI